MRPDPLLDVIFQPGEESLRRTLAAARSRRIRRLMVPAIASAGCLAAAVHLVIPTVPQTPVANRTSTVQIVSNKPLPARDLVQTSRRSVEVISTSDAAAPPFVADSELLASYAGGRAALVGAVEDRRVVEF